MFAKVTAAEKRLPPPVAATNEPIAIRFGRIAIPLELASRIAHLCTLGQPIVRNASQLGRAVTVAHSL